MREVIGFHNPGEENGYLSNWYLSEFTLGGRTYSSVEQYMMYQKAIYFVDTETAAKIMETDEVSAIKRLGRLVSDYDDSVWNGVRQIVVYKGLLAKFTQNDTLKTMLLETGDAILAECAVDDQIWGIGLSMKDPNRHNVKKWKGKNLLGYSLMMVRNEL